jgi:hypothetical protein
VKAVPSDLPKTRRLFAYLVSPFTRPPGILTLKQVIATVARRTS